MNTSRAYLAFSGTRSRGHAPFPLRMIQAPARRASTASRADVLALVPVVVSGLAHRRTVKFSGLCLINRIVGIRI